MPATNPFKPLNAQQMYDALHPAPAAAPYGGVPQERLIPTDPQRSSFTREPEFGAAPPSNAMTVEGAQSDYQKRADAEKAKLDQQIAAMQAQAAEGAKPLQDAVAQSQTGVDAAQREADNAASWWQQAQTIQNPDQRATAIRLAQEAGIRAQGMMERAQADLQEKQGALQTYQTQQEQATRTTTAENDKKKAVLDSAVKQIAATETRNRGLAPENEQAINAYNASMAQYGDKQKAYNAYLATKAKNEASQADVAAGKYKVDPYDFIQQGATLPERLQLLKQLNAGDRNPTMRAPALKYNPVVDNPGDAPTAPQLQNQAAPSVDPEVLKQLGYTVNPTQTGGTTQYKPTTPDAKPTATRAPAVAPKPIVSSASTKRTPTLNPSPATPPATNTPPPTTQTPPATNTPTTQQTSQDVASTNPTQQASNTQVTQNTAPAEEKPLNPSASLAAQPSGTVSGQGNSTGQTSSAPQTTPEAITKPKPFVDPDANKQDEEDAWHI